MTPLKQQWMALYTPIVEQLKLDVRMNPRRRCVELRTSAATDEAEVLQKGADFLKAFMLGFDVPDALALLRLDDLFVESFDVTDVKLLRGDHLGRAVGRVAGKDGKTKFAIENATRTRIVLADQVRCRFGLGFRVRVGVGVRVRVMVGARRWAQA
jgi:RNA-binding protein PNO1